MKLTTTRFGDIEVDGSRTIEFAQGIPGFEHMRRFVFLQPQEGSPFSFMQSVEDGDLAFVVTNPFLFFADYAFDLPAAVEEELGIREESDVMLFSIVTISKSAGISLNLLAPIVLNQTNRTGKQVILLNTEYQTKHLIDLQGAAGKTGDR